MCLLHGRIATALFTPWEAIPGTSYFRENQKGPGNTWLLFYMKNGVRIRFKFFWARPAWIVAAPTLIYRVILFKKWIFYFRKGSLKKKMNQQRIVDTAYDLNPEKSLIHGTRLVDWKLCPDKQANFDWKSQKDIIKSSSIHFTYESAIISKARVITRCPYSKVLLIPWLIQPQWHCQETHFNFFSHKQKYLDPNNCIRMYF